ncbi:TPA: hypothetical protein N0F65_012045 [Lagenidium giganteum]|uniref:FYVE-type domain-containing protein n=1 Tax=Lagenidium giganteum TaxID=4803 RepID=A0AAV2YUQ4_9STRA|nr:TPA: hypothetical protein N0F65_012045 [Lagenidium giganteum]
MSSVSSTSWDELRSSRVSTASSTFSTHSSAAATGSPADRWAPQHMSSCCNLCKEKFSLLKRSHRCRRCGYLFCQKCSRFKAALTGHAHKSRVCEKCFPKVLAGNKPPMNSFIHSKAWVPRGVFAHMLSYLNHVDLVLASMTCRFWYKRALLDITWRPLYIKEFGDDENSSQRESLVAFQRDIHGIGYKKLSWNKKFAIRWTAKKAAEKKKSFMVMSSLLSSLGLGKYAPIFEAEEIDIESLCLMNAGHLRDLGIPFGPRMKLLNAAACLADFNEDEEEERPSMVNKPVTPVSRFKQKRSEMKQFKASLVRRVQQSAVRIAILTNEGELCNVGSGIIIHESGLIATARHCLQGEQFDCIYSDDYMVLVAPTESTSLPPLWKYHAKAIPECCDEELDYALLRIDCEVMSDPPSGLYIGDVTDRIIARNWTVTKIEGTSAATIGKLPAVSIGNSNNVEPGEEMWMFGYPSSGHNTITVHHAICSGTDSQVYNGEEVDKAMLRTAAQLDNGFSGGAAVDKKGQLVGLISFSVLRQDRVRAINMVKVRGVPSGSPSAWPGRSIEMEQPEHEAVGVTLYPADYDTVEMVTEQGQEVMQQEFTDAQLFLHSIAELEKARMERRKKKRRTDEDDADDAADGAVEKENEPATNGVGSDGDVKMEDANEEPKAIKEEPAAEAETETTPATASTVDSGDQESVADGAEAAVDADDEDEEDVIDPRIHYRPMVAELQAGVAELHQLINSIDLIRRRDFLEEMFCSRENIAPKKEDLEYLVESKAMQVKESSRILLAGVDTLSSTVEKESIFFQGITQLIRKWKICAPIHGNIPKPFRAGEPLAVDCSYGSAGSTFVPQTRSIADLSYAELSRTDKGLVRSRSPEEYLPRTLQVQLHSLESGLVGEYTLPSPPLSKMMKEELQKLENTPEDLKVLNDRNVSVLKAVQFSVFCEEVFQVVMQEALRSNSSWTDTAFSVGNYALNNLKEGVVKKQKPADDASNLSMDAISVLEVLDDEVQLRVNKKYQLNVKLIDVNTQSLGASANSTAQATADVPMTEAPSNGVAPTTGHSTTSTTPWEEQTFLTETCRFTLLLLQQEIRQRHGRKDITRSLLYNSTDITGSTSTSMLPNSTTNEQDKLDKSIGALSTVIGVVGHCLLKNEVTRYLDELSAELAAQGATTSASGRVMDDGLSQPICDSVRGIYVSPRWKTCPHDSTISAFDLSIGKSFSTEVLIVGTRIRFEDGPASIREVSSLAGLKDFVQRSVCNQLAVSLHRDAQSFGLKQAAMDLDRASVRLFSAGDWDGSCIGEGRVSDTRVVGSIYLEPYFTPKRTVAINCMLQAIDISGLGPLAQLLKSTKGDVYGVEWHRIPGWNDTGKLAWLLRQTRIMPAPFLALGTH